MLKLRILPLVCIASFAMALYVAGCGNKSTSDNSKSPNDSPQVTNNGTPGATPVVNPSQRNPVGESANYALSTQRSSSVIKTGSATMQVADLDRSAATPSYTVNLNYNISYQWLLFGDQINDTMIIPVPVEFFQPGFLEQVHAAGQKTVGQLVVTWLGQCSAQLPTLGNRTGQQVRIVGFPDQPKLTNIVLTVCADSSVPAIGALTMDIAANVPAAGTARYVAAFDYAN